MKSSYDSTTSLSITEAFTAQSSRRRACARFTMPIPVITAVPLVSASPSRMRSLSGVMPHAFIASAAGTTSPRNETSDSPISASAICASCTKSPLAPTLPWRGTSGYISLLRKSARIRTTSGCTPDLALRKVCRRASMAARTQMSGSVSPAPQLCERMMLYCRLFRSASPIRYCAMGPKPVLMPYITFPCSKSSRKR